MFANIDCEKWEMEAVRSLLDSRSSKNPSNECITEGLEICLLNNNSRFAGTTTGAPLIFLFQCSD